MNAPRKGRYNPAEGPLTYRMRGLQMIPVSEAKPKAQKQRRSGHKKSRGKERPRNNKGESEMSETTNPNPTVNDPGTQQQQQQVPHAPAGGADPMLQMLQQVGLAIGQRIAKGEPVLVGGFVPKREFDWRNCGEFGLKAAAVTACTILAAGGVKLIFNPGAAPDVTV